MTQEMRQEIVTLAKELPDELLAEALVFLHSLAEKAQNNHSDNSSTIGKPEFDKTIAAYQVISEKYKNALRELAQ